MSFQYNFNYTKPHKLYSIIRPLAKVVIGSKYKIKYIGAENVPTDRGIIIASNHITALDPVIIANGCDAKMHFMAKKELFKNPIVARFLSGLNSFPVDRTKFDYDAVDYAAKLVSEDNALGIFPEGTRSKDFKPQKGKGGICYIAKKCKCDVVPVSIYTEDKAKSGTKLTVRYGKPIKYEELGFDENSEKMKDLRVGLNVIMEHIVSLWEEGHAD
ncbi:MAG: 1-acyl-sn-glycerol-3-phosphate acyltransferase [Ruminococcus sp.]|nr:1-acyl-sn-glycerol-3-phosphate acyltransferase [Candidatus Copronaster equi]